MMLCALLIDEDPDHHDRKVWQQTKVHAAGL